MRGDRHVGPHFCELSMGMSGDFEIAIESGATIVRIGSILFEGLSVPPPHEPPDEGDAEG
jgi:uncharacterized pyridoxal phosphate-containing UPF0001 family protein